MPSRLATRLAAIALPLILSTTAAGQVTLQLQGTLDGFALGTGNPGSIAAADGVLYVGSLGIGGTITQIDNPLTSPTSAGQLTGTLPVVGNGFVTLDTDGTTLVAATNNANESLPVPEEDIVQVFDVATGNLRYEASQSQFTPLTGGRSRIDGAAVDPITGNVWVTSFGSGTPTILDANSFIDVTDSPSLLFATDTNTTAGTGWRDIKFDPATGDIYLRGTNGTIAGINNFDGAGQTGNDDFTTIESAGATAGTTQIIDQTALGGFFNNADQSAINIEILPASFTGTEDIVIANTRIGQPALTPFVDQVVAFDANAGFDGNPFNLDPTGVQVPLTFLDSDGVSPFTTAGSTNGIYDFSFDAVNEVLYVSDEDNGVIYIFGEPGAVATIPGDFDMDGDVDGADFGVFVGEFQVGDTGGPGTAAPFSQADLNESGFVDGADFGIFVDSFQNFPPTPSAVPEPGAAVLVGIVAASSLFTRRRVG